MSSRGSSKEADSEQGLNCERLFREEDRFFPSDLLPHNMDALSHSIIKCRMQDSPVKSPHDHPLS